MHDPVATAMPNGESLNIFTYSLSYCVNRFIRTSLVGKAGAMSIKYDENTGTDLLDQLTESVNRGAAPETIGEPSRYLPYRSGPFRWDTESQVG